MTLKTMDAEKILGDALALPVSERAALAAALLASLDETEGDIEAGWAAEISRRAADARRR